MKWKTLTSFWLVTLSWLTYENNLFVGLSLQRKTEWQTKWNFQKQSLHKQLIVSLYAQNLAQCNYKNDARYRTIGEWCPGNRIISVQVVGLGTVSVGMSSQVTVSVIQEAPTIAWQCTGRLTGGAVSKKPHILHFNHIFVIFLLNYIFTVGFMFIQIKLPLQRKAARIKNRLGTTNNSSWDTDMIMVATKLGGPSHTCEKSFSCQLNVYSSSSVCDRSSCCRRISFISVPPDVPIFCSNMAWGTTLAEVTLSRRTLERKIMCTKLLTRPAWHV